tara:strand:+ start:801 stop:1847 length:1047 start_codon:yes stop_codon:yes gene_type:complete
MGMIKIPDESINFFKNNLDEIFESGNFAEGEWNNKLADYVLEMTGSLKAVPTNSNGAGLVALMSIYREIFGRSDVLIQSNTMYGVKAMVPASGCNLKGFIDCNINSLMPSVKQFKESLSAIEKNNRKNLIILLSHIGGIINPDIIEISEICKQEDIILLEDCAHSFGSTLNKKHSGLFGDAGVYSFYATKSIPAGEGGVVVTKNEELGNMVSDFAIYDRFQQKLPLGNNIRISEVQALLAFSVVKEWSKIVSNKISIADRYIPICKERKIPFINQFENGHSGNYYKFIITADSAINDIYPSIKTVTSPVYDYHIGSPNNVHDKHICLPIWYGLEENVINEVIEELHQA